MIDHVNEIELVGFYGSDASHALSAWTSTSRDLDEDKIGRIGKMLSGLAKDGHHTPFEKSALHFLVRTDIASHIHLLKHRIGISINAESARYKELGERTLKGELVGEDHFYVPADWPADEQARLATFCEDAFQAYHDTLRRLEDGGMSRKRAKETARFYLPYASQIRADIQFNWRSFATFQKLRNEAHAQDEIHEIAQTMLDLVEATNQFPLTIAAFRELGWLPAKK